MLPEKIIIDADPGVGDAIAIALALLDPQLDVIGLTATGGCVSGEQAFRNLQTIVSLIDPDRWPRLGWSCTPAASIPDRPDKSGLLIHNGSSGLGECDVVEAIPHQPTDSAKLLTDLVREYPDELTLITLGPLTNIQLALERHSEFLQHLKGIVCLGGSVSASGNATATAEFNIHADPEAARAVLTSPATKTLVPLETSSRFGITFDHYVQLKVDEFSRLGQFLCKTLPYTLRESRNQLGIEGLQLPELVALAAVVKPELFDRESMLIDVEISGELTRGMTVFDRRRPELAQANIDILLHADTVGIRDYMKEQIRLGTQH